MPNISLTDFTSQNREAERARQYAQMLQEQAIAPTEQQTINGAPVSIGFGSVLAKALQGYLGGRAARKADEKEAATKAAMMKEAVAYMNPNNLNVEQGGEGLKRIGNVQMDNPGIVDRLKGMMPQGAPQPMPQPMPQAPQPAAQAPQPMPQPMPQAPQPMTQAVNPNAAFSEDVAKAPFAIPQELQDRTRSPEERQRMLMAAALSDNEYLKPFAAAEYAKNAGKIEDKEKLDRQISAINGIKGFSEEQKSALIAALGLPAEIQSSIAKNVEPGKAKELPSAIQEYQFAQSQGYPGSYTDYQKDLKRAGATHIGVNIANKSESAYGETVGKGLGTQDLSTISAARNAPTTILHAQKIKELLNKGQPFTGTAADAKLAFAKAFYGDNGSVADTQELVSELAEQTLSNVKNSGLGAGQGFTDKDLKFLQNAKSGRISFTKESLNRLAQKSEDSARFTISAGNEVVGRLSKSKSFVGNTGLPSKIEAPAPVNYAPPVLPKARPPLNSFRKP